MRVRVTPPAKEHQHRHPSAAEVFFCPNDDDERTTAKERERRSREEEETLDVRIQNCVVVGKRTLVMMGLDYWKILSR